jgi:hypothetical protein
MKLRDAGFYSAKSTAHTAAKSPRRWRRILSHPDLRSTNLRVEFMHHNLLRLATARRERLMMERSPVRRRAGPWQTDRLLSSCIISGL